MLNLATQVNKHGIPVIKNSTKRHRKQRQQEVHKLNYKEFAEFVGYENGIEVTIIVPNHRAIVQAMQSHGWKLQKYSTGEIA